DVWLIDDALRYMNDPALAGDPDYYPDRLIGYEDNGYVHWNSGIANLWFHLLSEGGVHPRGKTTNVVTGITIQKAADIWYDTLVHRMTPGTTFPEARAETLATAAVFDAAAGTDYGASVASAWDAVGVYQITLTVLAEMDVPAQATDGEFRTSIDSFGNDGIRFDLNVPDGDADLYVRFGAEPTLYEYDCRPYTVDSVEECIIDPGQDGTYYVMVQAYSTHSAGTLTISSITYGATCEFDGDRDGVCDDVDNCPAAPNPGQGDGDGDGLGDACDLCFGDNGTRDTDGDGVCDSNDICPGDDTLDTDGDGVCDGLDQCEGFDDTIDDDLDGIPDCLDDCVDIDNDGVCAAEDTCPDIWGDGPDGCPTCDYADTISGGSHDYYLGAQSAGATLSATLDWTLAGADLNLYLQYERKGRWKAVASSKTSGFEAISYTVPNNRAGFSYRWQVLHISGTADYCLTDLSVIQ
ncbi:MAG: M4 family metallopeptidase, partial [Deltaproteobacteria bacterium]|nr:M4 family metallopeptidase [Deltaproteobacteria bacterium]